jgi:L-fuconolactonase
MEGVISGRIPVVDSHVHFWDFSVYRRTDWLQGRPRLLRNFLPQDLKPALEGSGVDLCIVVEAAKNSDQCNLWWLELAKECPYIGAAVAGCFLEQEDLTEWLDRYGEYREFAGVRATPAGPPEQWQKSRRVKEGLTALSKRDLSLDLLLWYPQLNVVGPLAAQFPELRFVLNHCSHPPLEKELQAAWKSSLLPLARHKNVYMKYSSLCANARGALRSNAGQEKSDDRGVAGGKAAGSPPGDRDNPRGDAGHIMPEDELSCLVGFLFDVFGPERMIWGSNWPVEVQWEGYEESWDLSRRCLPPLSEEERQAVFGGNAARVYCLPL